MKLSKESWRRYGAWILLGVVMVAALGLYGALYGRGGGNPRGRVAASAMTEEELRLARILSAIDGAGQVEVMIYQRQAEQPVFSAAPAEEPQALGVIVCAEGADSLTVRLMLQQAVATAMNLPADSIEIYPLAQNSKEGT